MAADDPDRSDLVTETVLVGSATGEVSFGESGEQPEVPADVRAEVQRLAETRFDLEDLAPGTILGEVTFDPDEGGVVDTDWEREPSD